MKTLDEVIKSYELQMGEKQCEDCSYCDDCYDHHSCECPYRDADALHYLKEYRMQLDDIVAKRKVLEYKSKRYDEMCETVLKHGQEHEDRCQAEIARYQEAVKNCEEAENKYRKAEQDALKALDDWASRPVEENKKLVLTVDNPPLDWEQLKQMEGKPVWVEMEGYSPHWGIVMNQDEKNGRLCLCGYDEMPIRIEIYEEGEGKSWQAYRKERGS